MKAASGIGIGAAFGLLALGAMMEGSQLPAFFNIPALLIVFGGTFGATLAATSLESMKRIPQLYKLSMDGTKPDMNARVDALVGYAEKARRDGLLSLES